MSNALFSILWRMPKISKRFPVLKGLKLRCHGVRTQTAVRAGNRK